MLAYLSKNVRVVPGGICSPAVQKKGFGFVTLWFKAAFRLKTLDLLDSEMEEIFRWRFKDLIVRIIKPLIQGVDNPSSLGKLGCEMKLKILWRLLEGIVVLIRNSGSPGVENTSFLGK